MNSERLSSATKMDKNRTIGPPPLHPGSRQGPNKRNHGKSFGDASTSASPSNSESTSIEPDGVKSYDLFVNNERTRAPGHAVSDTSSEESREQKTSIRSPASKKSLSVSGLSKTPNSDDGSEDFDDSSTQQEEKEFIQASRLLSVKKSEKAGSTSSSLSSGNNTSPSTTDNLEKPKRALTAYNFFLKEERQRILASVGASGESVSSGPTKKRRISDGPDDNSQASNSIGFMEIGKLIGKRWHEVKSKPERRARYEKLAEDDQKRFKEETRAYNEKKEKVLFSVLEENASKRSNTTKRDGNSSDRNKVEKVSVPNSHNVRQVPSSARNKEIETSENVEGFLRVLKEMSDKQQLQNNLVASLGLNNQMGGNQQPQIPSLSAQFNSSSQAAAQSNDATMKLIYSLLSQQMANAPDNNSVLLGGRQTLAQGMAQQQPDLNKLLMDYLQAEQMKRALLQGLQQAAQGQGPNSLPSILNNQSQLPTTNQPSQGNMLTGANLASLLQCVPNNALYQQLHPDTHVARSQAHQVSQLLNNRSIHCEVLNNQSQNPITNQRPQGNMLKEAALARALQNSQTNALSQQSIFLNGGQFGMPQECLGGMDLASLTGSAFHQRPQIHRNTGTNSRDDLTRIADSHGALSQDQLLALLGQLQR